MPPNLPTGWAIPPWLQVGAVLAFIASPFLVVFANHLKDKRPQNLQRDQALVDDQQGFIDKILKTAEKAPELLEKLEAQMNVNLDLRNQIHDLHNDIKELKERVKQLEADRDQWRRQAERVPQLEGQIETLTALLKSKTDECTGLQIQLRQLAAAPC